MSKKVSFEEIGEMTVTFLAQGSIAGGQVVKLSSDSTVKSCAAGEKFCGVAVAKDKAGCVAVQMDGFAQVACADNTVTAGYVSLTANGTGGVKKAGTNDAGKEYLVVAVGDGTAVIKM